MCRVRQIPFKYHAITVMLVTAKFLLESASATAAPEQQGAPKMPPKVQAVVDYLLKEEYPELFKDQPYQLKPTDYTVGDLDGDGTEEVAMSFYPHYLQSPTILLFRIDKRGKVSRVLEGLAPGPILKRSDDYLDSHTTGMAMDLTMSKNDLKDAKKRSEFVDGLLQKHWSISEYRGFFHTDQRTGKGTYLDMTHIDSPLVRDTCEHFEFSNVDGLKIIYKDSEKAGYLAAMVGHELYVYKIKQFRPDGRIDKSVKTIKANTDNNKSGRRD